MKQAGPFAKILPMFLPSNPMTAAALDSALAPTLFRGLAAALLLLVVTPPMVVAAPGLIDSVKKQIEWGEYDKIIAVLEPLAKNNTMPADTQVASGLFKYLGVAYFAAGKIADAKNAFASAFRLDPSVKLEEFYVSKEILDFFSVAIAEEKNRTVEQARADSLAKIRELDALASRYRTEFSLASVSFAVAAALGAVAVYEYHETDSLYWEWNDARQLPRGDKVTYDALKPRIKAGDALTESSAAAAVIAIACGTYFTVRARHTRDKTKKLFVKKVSVAAFPNPSFLVTADF